MLFVSLSILILSSIGICLDLLLVVLLKVTGLAHSVGVVGLVIVAALIRLCLVATSMITRIAHKFVPVFTLKVLANRHINDGVKRLIEEGETLFFQIHI